jgi:hypothetical protein
MKRTEGRRKMMIETERKGNNSKEWNDWKDNMKNGMKTMEKEGRTDFEDNVQDIEMRRKEQVFNMLVHRFFCLSQYLQFSCNLFARTAASK